jgi:signal transduction histidine kinase
MDGEPERGPRGPVAAIERAAQRMNRLIQDLLDVTSIEAGHLSIECCEVHVRQLLCDVLETQQALALSRGLELRLDPASEDLQVWADYERLLQVFENLIGNAAKFTAKGGRIMVGARLVGGEVQFSVADTGAGIAAADLPHLFERFWQLRKNERNGAGLGLAIVKGLVEAHGGRIRVESTPGVGSTFSFSVPVLASSQRAFP